jgi:hypothetical protein
MANRVWQVAYAGLIDIKRDYVRCLRGTNDPVTALCGSACQQARREHAILQSVNKLEKHAGQRFGTGWSLVRSALVLLTAFPAV